LKPSWPSAKYLGDVARPVMIIATGVSAAATPMIIAFRAAPENLELAAAGVFVGAIFAGVGALYWGRSWENRGATKHAAEVKIAQATGDPAPSGDGTPKRP